MHIALFGNALQAQEIQELFTGSIFTSLNLEAFLNSQADIYIYAVEGDFPAAIFNIQKPLLVHSCSQKLSSLRSASNIFRINALPTFLKRPIWEIVGDVSQKDYLSQLGRTLVFVPDNIGFPSVNVVSMIINEAFFALEQGVGSKADIDVAMKLGTNYPYGPFEWCEKIGQHNIYSLLLTLAATNNKFGPCALLNKSIQS